MSRYDNRGEQPVELGRGIAEGDTPLALRVRIAKPSIPSVRPDDQLWIPKSVIHDDSECYGMGKDESRGLVIVKAWWAEKNGHA